MINDLDVLILQINKATDQKLFINSDYPTPPRLKVSLEDRQGAPPDAPRLPGRPSPFTAELMMSWSRIQIFRFEVKSEQFEIFFL